MPAITGSEFGGTFNNFANAVRRLIRRLTPRNRLIECNNTDDHNGTGPGGKSAQARTLPQWLCTDHGHSLMFGGASTIYREQGNRLIAVKFSVRERDLASTVAEAQEKTGTCSRPPTGRNGAASSKKCRKPNIV